MSHIHLPDGVLPPWLILLGWVATVLSGEEAVFGVDTSKDYLRIGERIGVLLKNVKEQIFAPTVRDNEFLA
ncbi:MAG: hypothetical protein ACM3SR_09240 [Ignavibacteriales bacterium]